jgi:hypothetical protein
MSKKISVLVLCCITLLSALLIPVIHATKATPASGTWVYTPSPISTRWAGSNFIVDGQEDSIWTGTFDGTSYDKFTVVKHDAYPDPNFPRFVNVIGVINFEGKVGDNEGTLVIKFVGKLTGDPLLWHGTWVILSGTGDLENLRGRGTWYGPSRNLVYDGYIHFEPN